MPKRGDGRSPPASALINKIVADWIKERKGER